MKQLLLASAVPVLLAFPSSAQFTCPVTPGGAPPDRLALVADGIQVLHDFAVQEGPFWGWLLNASSLTDASKMASTIACTSLGAEAMVRADGWPDPLRAEKVIGAAFLLHETDVSVIEDAEWGLMRSFGFAFGLRFLRTVVADGTVYPPGTDQASFEAKIDEYLAAMRRGLLPGVAKDIGWIYDAGSSYANQPSFLTAPVLLSLVEAYNDGYDVDLTAVHAGLAYLEAARLPTGAFHYLGSGPLDGTDPLEDAKSTPQGAMARTPHCELALYLWGGSSGADQAAGVEFFFDYYDDLLDQAGCLGCPCSHGGPFQIGCHYIFYGHYQTALAIEQLSGPALDERRDCMVVMLSELQQAQGWWVDTFNTYAPATAMAVLALSARDLPFVRRVFPTPELTFIRGDANNDGALNLADGIRIQDYLFGGQGTQVFPLDAADVNDDGVLNIADPIYLYAYLFQGGPPPPPPFPLPGTDPTPDNL